MASNSLIFRRTAPAQLRCSADTRLTGLAGRMALNTGLTPYEFIMKSWAETLVLFHSDSSHLNLGLYI